MFRNDRLQDVVARRAGRLAFGVVLVAGASVLISHRHLGLSAAEVLLGSWLVAFGAGALVRWLAPFRGPMHPDTLFAPSIVVPSIGISLMLPLLIHLPFFLDDPVAFDEWLGWSLLFAGPTHIALAVMAAIRGARLVDGRRAQSIGSIYTIGICVACVPFAVLVVPVAIIAITGLPILALLAHQERLVASERRELAGEAELPTATLVPHAA